MTINVDGVHFFNAKIKKKKEYKKINSVVGFGSGFSFSCPFKLPVLSGKGTVCAFSNEKIFLIIMCPYSQQGSFN